MRVSMRREKREVSTQLFQNLIQAKEFKQLRQVMQGLEVADIAEIISGLEEEREFVIAFRLIKRSERHAIFAALPRESQEKLLDTLPPILVSSFINTMNPDVRTRLLEDLPAEIQTRIIAWLDKGEQQVVRMLLAHPRDSVGRLMTTDFVVVKSNLDITTALDQVRWLATGLDKNLLHNVLVTDSNGRYVGSVSLVELVTKDSATTLVKDLMHTDYLVLHVGDDREVAVDKFRKYDCDFMAVVDDEEKLQGMVTADDVFDVAEEEATEDMQQFGGQATLDNSYFSTPIFTLIRKRAGWLALLFVGELFTGTALKFYDQVILQMGFLIYFIPLVISTGGNSGTQAAALIIRGIAVREMRTADWFKVFRREIIIGVSLGAFLGIMGYVRATTWDYDWKIGIAIFLTIMSVVIFGALLGSMLPFLFKKLRLDPAVVSSPFIASLVDLFGILVLINIARLFITQ